MYFLLIAVLFAIPSNGCLAEELPAPKVDNLGVTSVGNETEELHRDIYDDIEDIYQRLGDTVEETTHNTFLISELEIETESTIQSQQEEINTLKSTEQNQQEKINTLETELAEIQKTLLSFSRCVNKGFEYDMGTGICYKYLAEVRTWQQARDFCLSLDTDLISIHSQEENELLQSIAARDNWYVWIGLSDRASEGLFQWSDGSAVEYENWYSDQPNGGRNQNCVSASSTGKWFDYDCESTATTICKM